MRKKARIAVVQPAYPPVPAEARPGAADFNVQAAKDHAARRTDVVCELFERAGTDGADLALGPEDMTHAANYLTVSEPDVLGALAEPIPGALTDRLGQIAARHSMYVGACFVEADDGRLCNTLVVLDRAGKVAWRYHKVHLPCTEVTRIIAGDEIAVCELDFAVIAGCICYDIIFPEHVLTAALKGADLILHPTVGFGWTEGLGEMTLRVRANDSSVAIAAALPYTGVFATGRSCIVDWDGTIVADAGYRPDAVVFADLDFSREREGKFADLVGFAELRPRLAMERRPEVYGVVVEKQPPVMARYRGKKIKGR